MLEKKKGDYKKCQSLNVHLKKTRGEKGEKVKQDEEGEKLIGKIGQRQMNIIADF